MSIESWGNIFTYSFLNVGYGVVDLLPKIIAAILFFIVGWVVAILLEKIVEGIFKAIKVDTLLKSAGVEEVVKRSGYNLNSGLFIGALIKWFVILVALMTSLGILGLDQVNAFLGQVVNYIPQVIVAVIILMVAVVVAGALQKIVVASSKAAHVKSAELLGRITKWSIWIFALLTALITLGIAPGLIQMILTALFAGVALAIGLAFGLGGKEVAGRLIEKTAHTILEKE